MFNKDKFKSIVKCEVSNHTYVTTYINTFLSPLITEIRNTARSIYIKQEAASVFPSDDNPYLAKLNLTLITLRTHLMRLLELYDREKHEVIKIIDERNLNIAYPVEGYELVQLEVEKILTSK